jgi:hypothetical protein
VAPQPDDAGLTEGRGTWVLPAGDGKITQIRIGSAFTLLPESWIEIRIQTPFTYGREDATRRFEPSGTPGLAPLLKLHQETVTSAESGRTAGSPRVSLMALCLWSCRRNAMRHSPRPGLCRPSGAGSPARWLPRSRIGQLAICRSGNADDILGSDAPRPGECDQPVNRPARAGGHELADLSSAPTLAWERIHRAESIWFPC